jgi:hypothetical protein
MEWTGVVMPTIRGDQFDVIKEMLREKDDIIDAQANHIDNVEEELELALEENQNMKVQLTQLMSDRSLRD